MSNEKLVNIVRLMTTYSFEIEQLPDNLKCAQCKLVLKDACQLPCCCRYCRTCVDDMIMRGGEFCPGDSEDCADSPLSSALSHFGANKRVSRLSVKCPHNWCVHESQLVNMEEHLRECCKKNEECPFRELGCTQNKFAAEEMGGHLQHDNRRHSEILIEMIANINKEIETLKHELVLKDGQIKSMMDQMLHLENENKSIKNEIILIKEENADLTDRVRILTEKIEREIAERRENEELNSAIVIEHMDSEIAAVTRLIELNKVELVTKIDSLNVDIGSINQNVQSVKRSITSMKTQMVSIQMLVGLEQVDASCVWVIDIDVVKRRWKLDDRQSDYFSGTVHQYKYRLKSANSAIGTAEVTLCIQLLIYAGPNDELLSWPFDAKVAITVTDRDRREACRSIIKQCWIDRPEGTDYVMSGEFTFLHSELRGAGLNLSRGVRVLCMIVPRQ